MALIKVGSINDFAVAAKTQALKASPILKNVSNFGQLAEVSRNVDPNVFELVVSAEQRGVALKNLKLTEGFDVNIFNLFDPTNELYFVAWAWDLSSQPVNQYPGAGLNPGDVIIPLRVGRVREFIGQGIDLFPKRVVKGGIAIRIMLWESDANTRNFGKAMSDTADAIDKSKLNNLLSLIGAVTGVPGATITMIKDAAIELAKVIGTILQANGDDYVDLFEGYYAADQPWTTALDTYSGNSSVITLDKY